MQEWIEGVAQVVSKFVTEVLGGPASFLEGYVWGWPSFFPLLMAVLLGTGLFVTLRMVFVQIRGFKHAIDITRGKYDDPEHEGDLKHFQALTTALSATVGIGNIAGVAIAIRLGGPGALFWMWVTAFFGMALKYTECTLAQKYRTVHPDGSVSGGPMYYIERGLGKNWKWMAIAFASFAAICSFCTGNMNQSNTMTDQLQSAFGVAPVWSAFIGAIIVGMVIIGGIRRIGRVTAFLAPFMAVVYVLGALVILVLEITDVPHAIVTIFQQAFAPESMVGGGAGSFILTLMWGIRRGLFSNEAGQGSAPIAHAAARTDKPVREGLVALLEPFIDTLVICTMTGLVIVTSGSWLEKVEQEFPLVAVETIAADTAVTDPDLYSLREAQAARGTEASLSVVGGALDRGGLTILDAVIEEGRILDAGGSPWTGTLLVATNGAARAETGEVLKVSGKALLTGAPMTARGFQSALPGTWGNLIVTFGVLLFAVSTAISWSYYGDRATEYLFGARAIPVYRWLYVVIFFLGGILPLQAVWTIGDVALGLMSFPNLIAVILLSGQVAKMTRDYFSEKQVPYTK